MRAIAHSRWSDPLTHGEHKGYVPGEDGPARKGYVRAWRHPDAVNGPGGLLATLTPFTGHSIRAFYHEVEVEGRRGFTYSVFSYDQLIAQWIVHPYDPDNPGKDTPEVWLDDSYYSQKTREHQGMVNAWLGHDIDRWIAPSIRND